MAILPKTVDFSDKDFDSLLRREQNLVRSMFPDWTDFNTASFGNILLELFAFVGENLTFYQDAQARESRIVTAYPLAVPRSLCLVVAGDGHEGGRGVEKEEVRGKDSP